MRYFQQKITGIGQAGQTKRGQVASGGGIPLLNLTDRRDHQLSRADYPWAVSISL